MYLKSQFAAMLLVLSAASLTAAAADGTPAAAAQPMPAPTMPMDTPATAAPMAAAPAPGAKLVLTEGTEISLSFVDSLTSATASEGDRFTLRLDDPVKVDGHTVIAAGSTAVGTVVSAKKRGFMGKGGDLNVQINYVSAGEERVRLRGNRGKAGDDKVGTAVTLTVLFGPLGLLKRGHDVIIKPGTQIKAYVDQNITLLAQN